MSARPVPCAGARRPCAPAVPTLLAVALVGLLACGEDQLPTAPDFKPVPAPTFTVSPTALQFIVPRDAPRTLTVTSKIANTISAASSSASCLVSPASAALTKPRGMADYTATFTVVPSAGATGPGSCTITLTDKKGGQTPVAVTLVASQVRLRQATVATGTAHSCALDGAGAAWCWGFNQYGSLGDGSTTNRSTPVAVTGGLTFASLTAGALNTCGLTSAGVGYCWGAGGSGQLGEGAFVDRTAPTPIAGGLTFVQLTASGLRTCGLTPAGKAYCWGRNFEGQVGDGTNETRSVPTAVANAIGGSAVVFARLEAGAAHACGLTSAGTAYCWGYNENGQVGDGTTNIQLIAPKAVNTNLAFTELTARNSSTCGLSGGALHCWGYNGSGQLGDGTTTEHRSPSPATGGPFAGLAGGGTPDPTAIGIHVCALTGTGAAYCWGRNTFGELGNGTNTDRSVPTAVTGPGGGAALAFATLSTGYTHTCGRTTGNAIYCWGGDNVGDLGNGSGNDQNTPTLVILGGRPTITSVVPSSSTIAIESSIPYDATLFNPGNSTLTGVGVQGYIIQGTVIKPAGGTIIECSGTFDAMLPPGSCTSTADLTVSNSLGGPEPLVPGSATYQLDLYVGTTIVDSETVPITLQ